MVTLQDVAKLAGVSVSTVSNVTNGRSFKLKPEMLERVQKAIDELGYQPNQAARFLKTGHTPLIGLLVPTISNPIYGSLAREVEVIAQEEYGYRILVGNTYRDPKKEMNLVRDLLSHGIRGVIIVSPLLEQGHFKQSIKRGLVAVSYDRRSLPGTELEVDYVSMDNYAAACIAVDHLVENGHSRIAYVTASGKTVSRMDKIEGFLAAASKAGVSATSEVIEGKASTKYGDAEMVQLGRTFAELIAKREDRPTAIVAMNDILAIGLILGLQGFGLKVPQDVSIIGFDDMFLSAFVDPGITTVRLPLKEMAKTMVSRIMFRLNNPDEKTKEFTFAPQLVVRGSVANLSAAVGGKARNQKRNANTP